MTHLRHRAAKASGGECDNEQRLPFIGCHAADLSKKNNTILGMNSLYSRLQRQQQFSRQQTIFLALVIFFLNSIGLKMMILDSSTVDSKRFLMELWTSLWTKAEYYGLYPALQHPFITAEDYLRDYPELKILEDHAGDIIEEAKELLALRTNEKYSGITDGIGEYFASWGHFVLKVGYMIEENRRWTPKTYDLITQVPQISNAMFSFVEPHNTIAPHWGYYKGYVKYHLGLIIPNNNEDHSNFIRTDKDNVFPRTDENFNRVNVDKINLLEPIGETYYWHEGEGVVFEDMHLHDVQNNSNETRVVLFVDLQRKLPWYLNIINQISLYVANNEQCLVETRKNAIFRPKEKRASQEASV